MHKDTKKILIGQVDFINCFPINVPFEQMLGQAVGEIARVQIVNGVPSKLNEMILKGEIDIAPVSSITYLENKDTLFLIADMCIASNGPADSVLLFSHFPIEELDGAKIATTYASATSNKLLEIILREFLKVNATFEIKNLTLSELSKDYPAALFIGDHALLEYSKVPRNIFIYDLGSLWKKYTGLPMVFGIWVVRKETLENFPVEMRLIASQLQESLQKGLGPMFDKVIKKAQERVLLSVDFYKTYFEHLKYNFDERCEEGLTCYSKIETPNSQFETPNLPAVAPTAS